MEIRNLNVTIKKKMETETAEDETEKYIAKLVKDDITITIVSDTMIDLRAGDNVCLVIKSNQTTLPTETTE